MKNDSENYEHSVFINCPFDMDYAPLFRAALFTIFDCGFIPRTALDISDASEVRIQKIYNIIGSSRLSIHDLSRTQLDSLTGLPRFNMPLELGIFLGAKFLGDSLQRRKVCLVFDEKPYRYQTYLSDVAGQDISWHANDPKLLAFRIRDWLAHSTREQLPSGSLIYDHFLTFKGELRHSCEGLRQKPDELTYLDFVHHVRAFKNGYIENLNISGERTVKNPRSDDIRRAIREIESKDDGFIILSKGANGLTYMQACPRDKSPGKWMLEYQDGDVQEHYQACDDVDRDILLRSFQNFYQGEERWRTEIRWKRHDDF